MRQNREIESGIQDDTGGQEQGERDREVVMSEKEESSEQEEEKPVRKTQHSKRSEE